MNATLLSSLKKFASCSALYRRINAKWHLERRIECHLLDVVLGVILWSIIQDTNFFSVYLFHNLSLMITNLELLIQWLIKFPAGLKLNAPLNHALASFFSYHIYVWQKFLLVVSVWLDFKLFPVIFFFGISVFLAMVSDVMRVLTVHIFCFYVYASKLTEVCFVAVCSLWRVFRGRKYNPLRKRVDSLQLDSRQLFIATLFFTILLFLYPTVIIYYLVFSTLYWFIRSVQFMLHFLMVCEDFVILSFLQL